MEPTTLLPSGCVPSKSVSRMVEALAAKVAVLVVVVGGEFGFGGT